MNKKIFLLFLTYLFITTINAQEKNSKKRVPRSYQQLISVGINLPTGNFSSTHFLGIAVDFSLGKNQFAQLPVLPNHRINIFLNVGMAYYVGKSETISSFPYRYPGFTFLHVFPGGLFIANKKIHISLAAGPALRMYNGNSQFNLGAVLSGTYYLSDKIGISPSFMLMKETGADALLAASLKGSWVLKKNKPLLKGLKK